MMKNKALRIALATLAALVVVLLIIFLASLIFFAATKDTGLPRIDVYTEGGAEITSKEDYVNCTVSLSGTAEEYCIDEASAGIRGRGNSTWMNPKKPYRIKFDEKTSVFGEKKNKSWVLLAMYMDSSLIKDRLAFTVADSLGTDVFVPSYNYVELYLNGKYQGLYLLTDQVDENSGRTDVKEDFAEGDAEVPFLVELDAYAPDEGDEGVAWFSVSGYSYTVKYPEADERYTDVQFEYIRNYIATVDSLCRKPGVTLAELSEYVDMDSFIDFYIVKELMGDPEINWKSVYMSKSIDGKLKMGPVWDFDWSVIGPSTGDDRNSLEDKYDHLYSDGNWFRALYDGSPEFREALAKRWSEARGIITATLDSVKADKDSLNKAALRERVRWFFVKPAANYGKYFDRVMDWLDKRIDFLDTAFS